MEIASYQQATDLDDLFGNDEEEDQMMADGPSDPEPSFAQTDFGENNLLSELLAEGGGEGFDLDAANERELEIGEKADDAIDYDDIADDDLAEDIDELGGDDTLESTQMLPGISDSAFEDLGDDDLFGPESSPPSMPANDTQFLVPTKPASSQRKENNSDLASEHEDDPTQVPAEDSDTEDFDDAQYRIQLALFAQSGKGYMPATEEENNEEWLKLEFPSYKKGETPFFNKLFPPRPVRFMGKTLAKPPRPIRPTKVHLELEQDSRLAFNSTIPPVVDYPETLVKAHLKNLKRTIEESEDESDDESLPGGLSMDDLEMMCTDIDTLSALAPSDAGDTIVEPRIFDEDQNMFDDEFSSFEHPVKKRRLGMDPAALISIHRLEMPSFDDPEKMTQKISRKVVLDMNDSGLLVEEVDPETVKAKTRIGEKTTGIKSTKERLEGRFKTSNDAEYDLLKQNHQHKIRGQLGHMTIEHSMPATRLQYPYYQVKLPLAELRNYHRKKILFKHAGLFTNTKKLKRKQMKGKSTKEIFNHTPDLTLGDNSTALLLEYSEEHPTMLSQTGMGNKIVNYYRRKTKEDTSRPKGDIGETSLLLPEDKSPFHIFGHIDAGESQMALYNTLYRAPIFKQPSKPQDFLAVRETTGLQGQSYYLRNIDHIYCVGQELPSTNVPGTHSRAVTTAAKNRLKAISFRIARRKKSHRIRVEDVTRHFPDTTDMQNRQKMKEFMVFSKEHKEWEMKPGESVPDEDAIQQILRPEEICLLESMQVGQQYLQDAGYGEDADDEDDDAKDDQNDSIEQQLAPWKTTKNFQQATQGKAMLTLYGDGDPSGRGEALSFIKTSMKGGFKALGAPIQDMMATKKELGGHSYNVARQQKSYEESIRSIWNKQTAALSSTIEPTDMDLDDGVDGQEDDYARRGSTRGPTMSATPGPSRRRGDDDTATSFSRRSVGSSTSKFLKIVRTIKKDGEYVDVEHIETDPAVIKQYMRIKEAQEANATSIAEIQPTGDADLDARHRKRLEEELARLQKNQARRMQRDKTKAALSAASPGATTGAMSPDGTEPPTPAATGPSGGGGNSGGGKQIQATQRKCANCGQVGHIKTNKKSVALLSDLNYKCRQCNLPFYRKMASEGITGLPPVDPTFF